MTLEQRPIVHGLHVPYLTLWSEESVTSQVVWDARLSRVTYQDPPGEPWEGLDRDAAGVLWGRNLDTQSGEPHFSLVHTARQRRCMVGVRCQICGERMASYRALIRNLRGNTVWTPPLCESCQEVALGECPHLRGKWAEMMVVTGRSTPVGYIGELYNPVETEPLSGVTLPLEDPALPRLVATMVVVELTRMKCTPLRLNGGPRSSH